MLKPEQLAAYIDHTLLRADATAADIEKLCSEAREYSFCCVCVNGSRVRDACRLLEGSNVKVASVAGFPLGAMSTAAKCLEIQGALDDGAREIDVVLNVGRLKDGDDNYVLRELCDIVRAAAGQTVKIILENCLLTNDEKVRACRLVMASGAQFVKTSTGFGSGGATVEDVALMRKIVGPAFGVKAAGGIRDAKIAMAMIEAGATRVGTSAGVAIVRSFSMLR
ncbi:MAG TPA: deoxyribose-phosphate aldolase [Acidobacteriota bacterium]|nr:deoxyribose-phosphate aldolase [Acidobacteriota bacterium]